MDNLIQTVNKLQQVLSQAGLPMVDLPQIAVVGSQSSGKSSVLENFVGKDFLPRGSGLVTRRPLVLQLNSMPEGSQEWGEFNHQPGVKYYNFNDIRNEINADTDRITGKNAGISNKPIFLTVFSPTVVNLTLIDLPGLTKVPVGDQPTDIEAQIRNMINSYITRPNCIILAVTAANTDIANSDALQLAKSADPEGARTIGVITKLDLMDKGTDARDVLMGKVIPLRRGFIGVINRSQQDINTNKTISAALDGERRFFETHPVYKDMMGSLGTPLLAKTLSKMLTEHIRLTMPEIKRKIDDMRIALENEMAQYGDYDGSASAQGAYILTALTAFADDFRDSIDGTMIDIPIDELYGGARVMYIFNEIFTHTLENLDPLENLTDYDIRTAIRNVAGATSGVFVPEESFELVVKRQIARLEAPAIECVQLVHDEMRRIVSQCDTPELERYPNLRGRVLELANQVVRETLAYTKETVEDLVQMELGYINTEHPDFIGASGIIQQMIHDLVDSMAAERDKENTRAGKSPARERQISGNWFGTKQKDKYGSKNLPVPGQQSRTQSTRGMDDDQPTLPSVPSQIRIMDDPTKRERVETEMIRALLTSYFDIARKNIEDAVPKAVMCFMVNKCKSTMEQRLLTELYNPDNFPDLLQESGALAEQRRRCHDSLQLLRKATQVLAEVVF